MTESASVLVLRMEKTTLFHVFLFTDKVGPLLIGITTLSCLLDNPEWGEFWIFCWLAMNTSQTPSHVPTFPSVSPLTVSNYPSGPMALHPTRIHWCAAIKSRAQLHSTAQHTCTARSSADKDCMIATGSEDWPGIVNVTVNTVRLSGLFLLLWCKCWQWTWYVHVTPCPSPPGHCDAAQLTIEEAWKGRPSNLSPTSQSPSGYNPTKNCCSCLSTLQGCWCPHWWWVSQCLWFSAHSAVDWAQIYLPPGQPGFPSSREDDFKHCSWNIHQLGVKHCWQIVHTNALQYMSGGQNHQRYETLKGRGSYKKGHFALAWKV